MLLQSDFGDLVVNLVVDTEQASGSAEASMDSEKMTVDLITGYHDEVLKTVEDSYLHSDLAWHSQ
jgi:hypothetical protein